MKKKLQALSLVVATKNSNKILEITENLKGMSWEITSLLDFKNIKEAEENGKTFMENAFLKASYYVKMTGCACIADDSGLVVDALKGKPGIYSARYAGEQATTKENNEKLLLALKPFNKEERKAFFCCAMVFMDVDGTFLQAEGYCEGYILNNYQGDKGFGYDPLFFYPPLQKTFAELSTKEKNLISHRGKALHLLKERIREVYN